ncbi:MAG: hypothetical protein V4508_21215 [Pseudomonadota bacterium]
MDSRLRGGLFKRQRWEFCLAGGMAALFAFLVLRNTGLYPAVFADEMLYSSLSRLGALAESSIPSYLYLALFRVTNACGTGFLDCARLLNTLSFVGAAPLLYLIAQRYCGKALAVFVSLLCLCAPIGEYTAFFMPETLYYFAFFVLSWVALGHSGMHWARFSLLTGVLLGVMSLIKVHALFLIPSMCLYTVYVAWINQRQGAWIRIGAASALLALAASLGVKFGVGYAIAGGDGLHLFGSFYGNQATGTAQAPLARLMAPAFINARGHLMTLAILFGLPMAVLGRALFSRAARAEAGDKLTALYLYTFLMLGAALAMTIMYTASIVDHGPREAVRLHLRYYNFAFPLLCIVGAAAIGAPQRAARPLLAWCVAGLLMAASVAGVLKLPTYFFSMVDGPEIMALDLTSRYGREIVLLNLAILALWALRKRLAAQLFIFVMVPSLTYLGNEAVTQFLAQVAKPNLFDTAGLFVRDYVKPEERGDVAVAGSGLPGLMRTKYHIDSKDSTYIDLPDGEPFGIERLPVRKKWLLLIGPHALPADLKPVVVQPDFVLVPVTATHRPLAVATLSQAMKNDVIDRVEGMGNAEPWGRWSSAKQVVLHFRAALPRHLNVLLNAQAYGPNAGQEFIVRVGGEERRFKIGTLPGDVFMRFETDGLQDAIVIEVPQPVSPKQLGHSEDTRLLGLGLLSVEIGSPAP